MLIPGRAYTNLRYKDTGDPEVYLWDEDIHIDTIYAHQPFLFIDWVQEKHGNKSLQILGPHRVGCVQVTVVDLDAIVEIKDSATNYEIGDFCVARV